MESKRISSLFIYPIKSCAGISMSEARLTPTGFEHDREFMLVDENRNFLSQRKYPNMALIRSRIKETEMVMEAPGMPSVSVDEDFPGERTHVKIWNDTVEAVTQTHSVNVWFQTFLGNPNVSLVRFAKNTHRYIDEELLGSKVAESKFSDQYPLTLVSEASVAELNTRLKEKIDVIRFRPNIVVSGYEPYEEDLIKTLHIIPSGITLKTVKPVKRCKIVNVDPMKGAIESEEVLHALASYRMRTGVSPGILFCVKVIVERGVGNVLRVGDEFVVVE